MAPFDGYVTARNVVIGQYVLHTTSQVTAPAPLITIANIDPLRARLKIPEKMASWVPVGQPVTLTVEAYPGKTFTGKISRINPGVDAQTRTFDAEALVENHERLLKPGFFAKASVDSTEVDRVLFVPQKALSYAYGIYKVYEVGKGNKLKEKEVKLGDHMGEDVELLGGVPEGDRLAVATEGQELAIKDGAVVKVSGGGGKKGGRGGKGAGDSEKADDGKTKGVDSSGSGSEGSS
jgi:membrane fusion protein (multidrug efflux system)